MRTGIPKNNFSSGQIDRDTKGRYDLPLYQYGHELSRNFFHTIKGDCYYRTGFEFLDEIGLSALYEFKFSQEQAYLLVFRVQYIEFWSYNENGELVRVLDGNGNEYTLVHPYGTEVFNLCMTQNCDVLYITHRNGEFPEYQLKRTASNQFELNKTIYTNTGTASLSSNSATENHGFPCSCAFYENRLNRCSSTKFPTYLYGSKGGDYNNITVGTGTNDGYQFDLAEANSKALWLMSGVNSLLVGTAEGILTVNGGSVTTAISPEDITAKLSCRDGVSNVLPIHKDNFVFFVSSNYRLLYMFEYDVLLEQFKSTNLSKGNYEITKGGISKLANKFDRFGLLFAVCNGRLLSICFSNDEAVNAWSEFITEGRFIDICTVTRPDGNFDLFANVKRTVNGITRYYLERLTETVEFSRFEDFVSEIPEDATELTIQEMEQEDKDAFNRKVAEELRDCNYLDCSMKYSGLQNKNISYDSETGVMSLNIEEYIRSIYQGEFTNRELSNGFIKITFADDIVGANGAETKYIGVYSDSVATSADEVPIGANLYKVISKDIYNDKYVNTTANAITVNGTRYNSINLSILCKVFDGKESDTNKLYYTGSLSNNKLLYYPYTDFNGNTYMLYVGKITALNTNKKTVTINADKITPSENYYMGEVLDFDIDNSAIFIGYYEDAFKSSDIGKRIWYKSKTGREYGIFDITGFIDNYHVQVNQVLEPTSDSCDEWYLSATYFTGLEHLEGETVAVVGNGGYIGDFLVQDGQIDISNAQTNKVGSAIIGLKYKGVLKSVNLGLMLQETQTYTTPKSIYKMGFGFSFSAGVKVGDSLYKLNDVQDFNPDGLFDTPPLPMDDYREVNFSSNYERDKYYYVVQDSPLPCHLTSIIPYAKQVIKT